MVVFGMPSHAGTAHAKPLQGPPVPPGTSLRPPKENVPATAPPPPTPAGAEPPVPGAAPALGLPPMVLPPSLLEHAISTIVAPPTAQKRERRRSAAAFIQLVMESLAR